MEESDGHGNVALYADGENVPTDLWGEAISTVVYLLNHSFTSAVGDCTLYEALTGFTPTVDHLRVFNCLVFAHIHPQQYGKLDLKAEKLKFIGYSGE